MWDSLRADREQGRAERTTGAVGHFICLDGFGQPSEHERAAGMEGHGEAHRLEWSTEFAGSADGAAVLRQSVTLPRVREVLRREVRLPADESVVYVRSSLTSLLDFDRPVNWAEHATIGSPFLERGVTVVDISANRAMTRPRTEATRSGLAHRLIGGKEFSWPMALAGQVACWTCERLHASHTRSTIRATAWIPKQNGPSSPPCIPASGCSWDTSFRASEFPWLQTWESYPRDRMMARGLEFGTQAFDLPRREVITQGKIFDTLLYRWLPARSTINAGFLMFLTRTPEGFQGVDEIDWQNGVLTLRDRRSGQQIQMRAKGSI